MRHRHRHLAAIIGLSAALSACEDPGTGPAPDGEYHARLESPAGAEGAAVIEMAGGGIREIRAVGGTLFSAVSAQGARVVVVLDAPGAIEFTVRMADGSAPPSARVLEVADGGNQLRADLSRYRVRLDP